LTLSIHAIPNNNGLVILEGEWEGSSGGSGETPVQAILKEFLEGCLPEAVGGERKFVTWQNDRDTLSEDDDRAVSVYNEADDDEDTYSDAGSRGQWEGVERHRKVTQMLAQTLREAGVI
jgi:hypothetical protein